MKSNNSAPVQNPSTQVKQKPQRTINKDKLDSRETEEWDEKGDNTTHNKKEHHSEGKKH